VFVADYGSATLPVHEVLDVGPMPPRIPKITSHSGGFTSPREDVGEVVEVPPGREIELEAGPARRSR